MDPGAPPASACVPCALPSLPLPCSASRQVPAPPLGVCLVSEEGRSFPKSSVLFQAPPDSPLGFFFGVLCFYIPTCECTEFSPKAVPRQAENSQPGALRPHHCGGFSIPTSKCLWQPRVSSGTVQSRHGVGLSLPGAPGVSQPRVTGKPPGESFGKTPRNTVALNP